jgi:glycosyltransferase involved in cell wall biosynthesis
VLDGQPVGAVGVPVAMSAGTLQSSEDRGVAGASSFNVEPLAAIHALAQLPDTVTLDAWCEERERPRLRLLAEAYGIAERVAFHRSAKAGCAWSAGGRAGEPPSRHSAADGGGFPVTMGRLVESLWPSGAGSPAGRGHDGVLAGHRIAVLTNLPAHYRIPLFTGMSTRLEGAGASLRVFFLGSRAAGRPWLSSRQGLAFGHEFVSSVELPVRRRRRPFAPLDLWRRLEDFDPSIVVAPGFSPLVAIPACRYSRRRRIPFGLWSGEIPATAARRSRLNRLPRGWLARRATFGISYGSLAESYLRRLAPDLPVVHGRNTSVTALPKPAREPRPSTVELLAVADLALPGKGVEVLLEAMRLISDLPCRLTVIGGTGRRGSLGERAGGDGRVRFVGALPVDQVRAAYEASHVFLFPSRVDVFGLALVEAMASGLATVVSQFPGAVADLGVSGHNCLVVRDRTPASWAGPLRRLVTDHELRLRLGDAARRTIERRWTMSHAVEATLAGLRLGALSATRER